ncbi:hypothetical protein [Bradyrhizobium yuanmingense]|uniref:hypothetical protein n=1 Tax=Bradyrhizobium yuanmingense TaxID=108015 RepID=UPI003512FC90
MYGVNASDLPSENDKRSAAALRQARPLSYAGVTRPGKEMSPNFSGASSLAVGERAVLQRKTVNGGPRLPHFLEMIYNISINYVEHLVLRMSQKRVRATHHLKSWTTTTQP